MKWIEITVTTAQQAAEAVANILLECRTGGVEEMRSSPGVVQLRGYLPVGPATDVTLAAIEQRVRALPQFGLAITPGTVATVVVEDSGWAHAWKNHFRPFPVGRRIWITPTWDTTSPPADRIVIELDPGMAFGSGLHPSTQLCLMVLEDRLRGAERLIDVGTGSGVLSIAAARLGAARVLAVDADPVAVEVARHNVAHNGVAGVVEVRAGDLLHGVGERADLIVANLTADIHLDFLPTVPDHLAAGGSIVASGIVADRHQEVEAVAAASGLRVEDARRDAEWRCLVLTGTRDQGPGTRQSGGGQ